MEPKNNITEAKPGLNIKFSTENESTIEILDDIELSEEFKESVLNSYLNHLFEDLSSRNISPGSGISQATFLDVSLNLA